MTCPKCGSDAGWSGPKYWRSVMDYGRYGPAPGRYGEYLQFTCLTCGYVREEHCKDYVEPVGKVVIVPPPPEPPPRWKFRA